jgi:hypothetical protein
MSDLQRNLFFGNFIPNAAIAKGQQNDQYGQDNKKKNFFENARDSVYTNARALGKAYEAAIPNDIVRGMINGSVQNMVPGAGLVFNKPQQQSQPKTLQDKQQIAARNLDVKGGAIAMNSAWNSVPVTAAKNLENIVTELPSYAGGFLGAMVPGAVAGKLANNQGLQKAVEIGSKIPGVKQLGEAVKGVGSIVAPAIGGIGGMMAPTMTGTVLPNVGNALNNYRSFATNTVNQYATPLITEDKIDPETWANLSERTKKYIQTRDKKYLPQDEKGNPRSLREELLNADRYRGFQRFQQEVLKDYQAGHVTREQAINAMKQYKTTASAPNFATDMLADATNLIMGGAGKVGKVAKLAQGAAESGKISQIADRLIPENKIPQIIDQYRPNAAGSPDILDYSRSQGIGVDKNYIDYMKSIPKNQSPSVLDPQGRFNYLTEVAQPSPQVAEPYQKKGSEQINFKRKGGRNEIPTLNEKVKGQKTPEIVSPSIGSNLTVDEAYARRLSEQPTIQQGYSGQNPPELQAKSPNIENFDGKVDLNSVPVADSSPQITNNSQVAGVKPNKTVNIPENQPGSPSIQEIRPISDKIEQSVGRKEGELLGKYEALAQATDNKTKSKIKRQIADRKETIDEYKQEVLDKRTEFRPLGSTFNPETEKFVDNLSNDLYDNFTAAPIVDDIAMRDKEPVKFKNKLQEVMFNLGTIGRIKKRALKPEEEHYISEAKKFFSKNYGFDDEAFAKFADEGGYVRANIMKGLDQGWAKEAYKGLGPEGYTADKLRKLSRIPSTQDIPEVRNQDLQDISNQIEREFGTKQGIPKVADEKGLVGAGEDRSFEISNRNSVLEPPIDTYKVTETPKFKKWFGDSKVVDENGKPLVVYHGTGADFNTFKPSYENSVAGIGVYFTTDPSVANMYSRGESPNTKPVFLAIRQPLDISKPLSSFPPEFRERFLKEIAKTYSLRERYDNPDRHIAPTLQLISQKTKEKFTNLAKDFGYDGVKSRHAGADMYIAFEPNQIKSATGNSGKFDPNNPDIRAKSSGEASKELPQVDKTLLAQTLAEIQDKNPMLEKTISQNSIYSMPDKEGADLGQMDTMMGGLNPYIGLREDQIIKKPVFNKDGTPKLDSQGNQEMKIDLNPSTMYHEGNHSLLQIINEKDKSFVDKTFNDFKSKLKPEEAQAYRDLTRILKSDEAYKNADEKVLFDEIIAYNQEANLGSGHDRLLNQLETVFKRSPELKSKLNSISEEIFNRADRIESEFFKNNKKLTEREKDIAANLKAAMLNFSKNEKVNDGQYRKGLVENITNKIKSPEENLSEILKFIEKNFPDEVDYNNPYYKVAHMNREATVTPMKRAAGTGQVNPDARGVRPGQYPWHFMRTPDELALEKNHPPMKISDFTKEIDEYVKSQKDKTKK